MLKSHQDFPKKGILFYDIFPLFQHPNLVEEVVDFIAKELSELDIDAIAALDARGFLLGPWIAAKLKVPFYPIRKKGKLPGPTLSISSSKEYGKDVLEIQKDDIEGKGLKFLLFDDLLATGGSLKAAEELLTMTGNTVNAVYCMLELKSLAGREKLTCSKVNALLELP